MRGCLVMGSVVLALTSFASAHPPADEEPGGGWRVAAPPVREAVLSHLSPTDVSLNMEEMRWQPAPPTLPAGTRMMVLQGDPAQAGRVVTIRLRFPAGAVVPPHTHSTDEAATVISGRFHVAPGDVLDRTGGTTLTAGGFTTLMAGHPHSAWVDGVTVVQFSGLGPLDIKYVNPADDPGLGK